jgi:hypothetical protein
MQNTTYAYGFNEKSPLIINFWKLMNEYDNHHRVLYLRFAWGRSRLPLCSADFDRKHELHKLDESDKQLP